MGDLSQRLSRHEFACNCGCGFDTVDYELVSNLEQIANHFLMMDTDVVRTILHINSGNRCVAHNDEVLLKYDSDYVPGSSRSQHLHGRASDFRLSAVKEDGTTVIISPNVVADYLEERYRGVHGIGRYNGRTHYDTRTNGPARWDTR